MMRKILSRIIVAGGISLLYTTSTLAGEVPTNGIVYNTKETNSLVYFCKKSRDDSLDCEFTHTRVRMKAKAEDLKASLDGARKVFHSTSKDKLLPPAMCKEQQDLAEVLHGRKEAQDKELQNYVKNISDIEKKHVLRLVDALTIACNSKTEESYLNILRISHDKDSHTCVVSSNTFKQSFRLVRDLISNAQSWVAKGDPSGPCGIVQLSRFEQEKLTDLKATVWKYISKKAITNKQGFLDLGIACKDLDEDEYIYDWRPKEYTLDCDYIKFSPL